MAGGVAPDGSPVAVYLALPAADTPAIVDGAVGPRSSILELGSGPGRITRPLLDLGHTVVAVDNSHEMLAHIDGAETVLADVFSLSLDRTFDVVLAGSHLINAPSRAQRLQLLAVCRQHVHDDGIVLLERYDPAWAAAPEASENAIGPVRISFEPLIVNQAGFEGRVTYALGDRSWTQQFSATNVTDSMLKAEAAASGLYVEKWLTATRTWAQLRARRAP